MQNIAKYRIGGRPERHDETGKVLVLPRWNEFLNLTQYRLDDYLRGFQSMLLELSRGLKGKFLIGPFCDLNATMGHIASAPARRKDI